MRPIVFFLVASATGFVTWLFLWMGTANQWLSWPSMTVELISLNVLVTSSIYFWLFKTKTPMLFVNSYLLGIVMKLIFYTSLLLIMRLLSPQALTANAILLLICYFIFTVLEVFVLFVRVNK